MRKMFLLFGMLATVGFLFVACTDEQATGPDEAAFGKKAVNCDLEEQTQLAADIRTGIGTLFNGKKNAKAATEMFNNVERKVCKGLLADATNTAYDFYVMTFRQLPDKLSGDEVAAAALVDMVFAFAAGLTEPGSTIPPEAMLPTGGLGVFDPVQGGTVYTNNFEAVLKADPNQFPGPGPVVVILTRLPDPDPEVGSPGIIPGYLAFAEAYNVWVNQPPVILGEDPGVLVAVCVVDDYFEEGFFDQLVIGHKTSETTGETWTPAIKGAELSALVPDLYCEDATADLPESFLASGDMPFWLKAAGTILEPVANRVLDVQPLNAMYFGGKGLGGRGGSLSPIAPVDGTMFTLDLGISGEGLLEIDDEVVCGQSQSAAVCNDPEFPAGTEVWIDAYPNEGFVFDSWTGCEITDGPLCRVTMDADKAVSATFVEEVVPDYPLIISMTGLGRLEVGGTTVCEEGPDYLFCSQPSYPAGTTVVVQAFPYPGWVLSEWPVCSDSGGLQCDLGEMDGPKSVEALFEEAAGPVLVLTVPARALVSDGASFACDGELFGKACQYVYTPDAPVTLTIDTWPSPTEVPLWLGVTCTEGSQTTITCSTVMSGPQAIQLGIEDPA